MTCKNRFAFNSDLLNARERNLNFLRRFALPSNSAINRFGGSGPQKISSSRQMGIVAMIAILRVALRILSISFAAAALMQEGANHSRQP